MGQRPSGISKPALLLVSTRPALCRPHAEPQLEWVLDDAFKALHGVEEWRQPAFELRVTQDAPARIKAWLETGKPSDVPQTRLVVAISPGSLELLRPCFPDEWPEGLHLGLMGDGSAAKARALGIPEQALVHPRQALGQTQDSAGLLSVLASMPQFAHGLLLKGNGGNAELAPALQSAIGHLTVLQAYRRSACTVSPEFLSALQNQVGADSTGQRVFYITSSEAVGVMAPAILACTPTQTRVWVTHPRIESVALAAGLPHVSRMEPGAEVLRARIASLLT